MRLPHLLSLLLMGCSAVIMANEDIHLKITTRNEVLKGVLAGIHAFSQIELLNTVSTLKLNVSCKPYRFLGCVLSSKMLSVGPIHHGRQVVMPPFQNHQCSECRAFSMLTSRVSKTFSFYKFLFSSCPFGITRALLRHFTNQENFIYSPCLLNLFAMITASVGAHYYSFGGFDS